MKQIRAFTLIELLIVLAIMSIMAVIVLMLINPTELISRSHDAGRVSAVNQLGHQVQAYYTTKEGLYPDPSSWDSDLVITNEIGSFPPGIDYIVSNGVTECTTNLRPLTLGTYCYDLDTTGNSGAIIYTKLEAKNKRSKCNTAGEFPYFVYSTADGRGGLLCQASDPSPWAPGSVTYVE